jgi:hypothetical protein
MAGKYAEFKVNVRYAYSQIDQYLKAIDHNCWLLYGYMDQFCKLNGFPLGAHFIYLNFDSILS